MDDESTMYDLIVHSLDELTEDKIDEARANRKARLAVEAFDKAVKQWEREMKGAKPRQITFKEAQPLPEKEDVVVRVMTF